MADKQEDAKKIYNRMTNYGTTSIRFETSENFDQPHTTIVHRSNFLDVAADGLEFPLHRVCNDTDLNGKSVSHGVMGTLKPVLDTFLPSPVNKRIALMLAEPHFNGNPLPTYPRFIARKQLQRLEQLGFGLKSAFHLEFSLDGKENLITENLLDEFLNILIKGGIKAEFMNIDNVYNHIDGTYTEVLGIKGADHAHLFKTFIKDAATNKDLRVNFFEKQSSQHLYRNCFLNVRFSLWDAAGCKDLIYDANSSNRITDTAGYWMAGVLEHMPAITRLMIPSNLCWKRNLWKAQTEPVNDMWGKESTSSSLRLHTGGEGKTFIETRQGTGRCNPYLLLAAVVAAGIDGIEKKLPLSEEGAGSGKEVPNNFTAAIAAFKADKVLQDAFGTGESFI